MALIILGDASSIGSLHNIIVPYKDQYRIGWGHGGVVIGNTIDNRLFSTGTVVLAGTNVTIGTSALGARQYLNLSVADIQERSLRFIDSHGVSWGSAVNGYTTSVTASVEAGINSSLLGSIYFNDANGVTWGSATSGNSTTITASVIGGTMSGEYAGTVFSTSSVTGSNIRGSANTAGISLSVPNYVTRTGSLLFANNSGNITWSSSVNNNSTYVYGSAPVGGGSGTYDVSHTHGNVSGINISATSASNGLTLSVPNYLTTAALSNHSHGNVSLALTNLSATASSRSNGLTLSLSSPPPASGVTDHGLLTGLGDDDHTQYHNAARADTWLAGKTFDHGALSGKDDDDHPHYLTQGRGDARYSQLLHKHAGEDITSGTIDGNRLPAISTTKKGAVPPTSDPPTGKVLSDGNSWVAIGDLYNPFQTLTDDEYVDWNLVNGKNARVTLGGNRTLRLTTPGNGMSGFLLVRQDGTGSRTLTLPAGSLMMEGGSLTLDTAPNARTFLYFEYDGTNYFWHRVREYALPDHNHDAYYVSVVSSPDIHNFPMLNTAGELANGSYGPSDFAAASHNHAATAITSGTLDGDRLPAMSGSKKGAVPATGTPTGKFLNDRGSWVGPSSFYATFQTLEDPEEEEDPVAWNLLNGYNAKVTLEGNRALSITNASSGMSGLLIVKQDATGNRTLTLPSGSIILGGGSLTLSTAANAVDILTFVYDGTNYYWSLGKGYA